ncbi:hypothetical protein F0L74_00835 [Chitinophaga agrisoli]|uniref:Uncharacterized protein n=1 Tax=Chitinophaga agrisoli TaxID=2607653 RepID=A0A5B2W0B8_9BACT|nr:hypothetical protein [Chitinophaga agrisoli]KAA2244554.1 hypothetical protein F0L74_00835 [Chitinophaga agrisoli]
MRQLLHEVQEIDQYLLRKMPAGDKLVFEARILTDPQLEENANCQQQAHQLIRWLGRAKQRVTLHNIHHQLWQEDAAFKAEITAIFK